MKHVYQKPDASIAGYVRTVLVVEGHSDSGSPALPLFTNGMPALLCRAENNTRCQLTVFGQSVPAKNWTINRHTTLITYFFKPFALGTVFGLSAKELAGKPIDLSRWKPQKALALNLQLHNAGSTGEKTDVLNHFIGKQIENRQRECEIIKYATDRIMGHPDTDALLRIREELGLNERTFLRIFKKYVGVTPSRYRRICQFQFAFTRLKDRQFNRLTDLAFEHGYADQSHFIRSFREFTDITPRNYLQSGLPEKSK